MFLRGRTNAALYFSLDGKNYELGAKITTTLNRNSQYFRPEDSNTYFDVEYQQGNVTVSVYAEGSRKPTYTYSIGNAKDGHVANWLYIKEVLVMQIVNNVVPYIGVGAKQWTEAMFTAEESYFNASGVAVESAESSECSYAETVYRDLNGTAVALQKTYKDASKATEYYQLANGNRNLRTLVTIQKFNELTATKLTAPSITNNSQPYINAYRNSYELPDNSTFETDYFYTREYNYSYSDIVTDNVTSTYVAAESNYTPWDATQSVENMFDGDLNTTVHTARNYWTDKNGPTIFTVALSKAITADTFVLYPSKNFGSRNGFPQEFKLEGSVDGKTYFAMGYWRGVEVPGNDVASVNFALDDTFTFKYYKFTVISTESTRVAFAEVQFANNRTGVQGVTAKKLTPDSACFSYVGDWSIKNAVSTFGKVYVGKKDATLKFEFSGTRLGILSSSKFGANFEVYIDGNKVDSLALKDDNGAMALEYLCGTLSNSKHQVEIKCTGEANIDSIVVYQ